MSKGQKQEKPYRMLLLASYCGTESAKCSEALPCDDCLKMCNVFDISRDALGTSPGGLDYLRDLAKDARRIARAKRRRAPAVSDA